MGLDAAAAECRDLSRQVRGIPSQLRDAWTSKGVQVLAEPLARRVAASFTGPWSAALSSATRAADRDGDPSVVVGGQAPLVRGGATGTDLLAAVTGPSLATVAVTRRTRNGGRSTSYRLPTGRQFRGRSRDTVDRAVADGLDDLVDAAADDLVGPVLDGLT